VTRVICAHARARVCVCVCNTCCTVPFQSFSCVLALPVQAEHEIGEEDSLRARWIYLNCEQCSTVFSSFFCPGTIEIKQNEPTRSRWRVAGRRFIRRGEKPNGGSPRGMRSTETSVACVFLFYVLFSLFSSTSLSLALLPLHIFFAPHFVCLNEPPPWEPLVDDDRFRLVENATTETMDRLKVDW